MVKSLRDDEQAWFSRFLGYVSLPITKLLVLKHYQLALSLSAVFYYPWSLTRDYGDSSCTSLSRVATEPSTAFKHSIARYVNSVHSDSWRKIFYELYYARDDIMQCTISDGRWPIRRITKFSNSAASSTDNPNNVVVNHNLRIRDTLLIFIEWKSAYGLWIPITTVTWSTDAALT